jgi:hypothetical protein
MSPRSYRQRKQERWLTLLTLMGPFLRYTPHCSLKGICFDIPFHLISVCIYSWRVCFDYFLL